MPEIKLNLRANRLLLFRYLSAIILNYLNQFQKRSNIEFSNHYIIPSSQTARVTDSRNFKFNDVGRFKEQYLTKIESIIGPSIKAQLKRKIAGAFEADTAYQILTSYAFKQAVENKYYIKLLKNTSLSDHIKFKI
ncbi:replicative DNA helicase [Orientia tsutsugamushi]|nr:replicative DNA helicase [Orientia tsutsugamushi]